MKKLIIISIFFLPLQIISGQDRIITNQQDTINCLIIAVWKSHIEYQQKNENGYMVGKSISIEEVSDYFRKNQLENYLTFNQEKSIPDRRLMVTMQVGSSNILMLNVNKNLKLFDMEIPYSQSKKYLTQLKSGWNFDADIHYLFSDKFGLGVKYSLFTTSALQEFTLIYNKPTSPFFPEVSKNTFLCAKINEIQYIHYFAPSVYFQQWIGNNQKFQASQTLSAGDVYYRCESRIDMIYDKVNTLIEGKTLGINAGLSVCYFPTAWFSVGFNVGLMYARLTKMNYSAIKNTERIKIDEEVKKYLSRFDYSLCLRFHF